MYIFSTVTSTRSSTPMLDTNSQSNGIRSLSQTQTDLLSRNKDTTNMSDKISSKNLKMLSKMKLPQQQQQRQQQIVSLNQGSSSNSNNNKLREDVISQQQQQQQQQSTSKETVVSASNAVAAELKGAPMLSIHENDNNSSSIDGHFSHNTLDEYYREPMYFGTENSTTVNTQIGATAHLPCSVHNIGEGVVSIFPCFCRFIHFSSIFRLFYASFSLKNRCVSLCECESEKECEQNNSMAKIKFIWKFMHT